MVGALPYLQNKGKILDNVKIISTSPTAKMASRTLYEYFIQRKEMQDFDLFNLQDVEKVFEKVELLSFNEHRKIRSTHQIEDQSEIILSAHPSGSAIGGTCWKIEYNK
jgi:Cft2 family RNA processing exonuclease